MFRSIAQSIRKRAWRKSIEPNFSTTLTVRNKELQEYFESKSVMMMEKSKSSDEKGSKATYVEASKIGVSLFSFIFFINTLSQVFCTDSEGLIVKTIEDRDLDPETLDIHMGFDGGQGFLKIGFTVTERPDSEDKKVF